MNGALVCGQVSGSMQRYALVAYGNATAPSPHMADCHNSVQCALEKLGDHLPGEVHRCRKRGKWERQSLESVPAVVVVGQWQFTSFV